MENRVYNEYNVEELQASFGYVSHYFAHFTTCSANALKKEDKSEYLKISDQLDSPFGRSVS